VPTTAPQDITIKLVGLDDTFALRKAVLRPWLTPERSRAAYAGYDEQFHVAALSGGQVVSTAAFLVDPHPDHRAAPFEAEQWRLRGMATAPELQGQGLGGQVLAFGVAEIARRLAARGQASATLWCNGRTTAERFYRRHGFQAVGEVFETPGTGPHYVFWRRVAAP
jgi:GNAT superfamily N-acetyltransferase